MALNSQSLNLCARKKKVFFTIVVVSNFFTQNTYFYLFLEISISIFFPHFISSSSTFHYQQIVRCRNLRVCRFFCCCRKESVFVGFQGKLIYLFNFSDSAASKGVWGIIMLRLRKLRLNVRN